MRSVTAALLLLTAACGGVKDANYAGAPIATIHGFLRLPAQPKKFVPDVPVRLALAWTSNSPTGKSFVAQNVDYRGTFPIAFSLDLDGRPPAESLQKGSDGNLSASASIIAYQDLNGNGQLDTIPASGEQADLVVGIAVARISYSNLGDSLYDPFSATYPISLPVGYSQTDFIGPRVDPLPFAVGAELVPFDTPIDIELTGEPALSIAICDGLLSGSLCGIPLPLVETSQVGFIDGASTASISVTLSRQAITDGSAVVQLNGRTIPAVAGGTYALSDAAKGFVVAGANVISVEAGGVLGLPSWVEVPDPIVLTSPSAGSTLRAGDPLHVSWTGGHFQSLAFDDCYLVQLLDGAGQPLASTTLEGLSTDLVAVAGTARVNVQICPSPGTLDSASAAVSVN